MRYLYIVPGTALSARHSQKFPSPVRAIGSSCQSWLEAISETRLAAGAKVRNTVPPAPACAPRYLYASNALPV